MAIIKTVTATCDASECIIDQHNKRIEADDDSVFYIPSKSIFHRQCFERLSGNDLILSLGLEGQFKFSAFDPETV